MSNTQSRGARSPALANLRTRRRIAAALLTAALLAAAIALGTFAVGFPSQDLTRVRVAVWDMRGKSLTEPVAAVRVDVNLVFLNPGQSADIHHCHEPPSVLNEPKGNPCEIVRSTSVPLLYVVGEKSDSIDYVRRLYPGSQVDTVRELSDVKVIQSTVGTGFQPTIAFLLVVMILVGIAVMFAADRDDRAVMQRRTYSQPGHPARNDRRTGAAIGLAGHDGREGLHSPGGAPLQPPAGSPMRSHPAALQERIDAEVVDLREPAPGEHPRQPRPAGFTGRPVAASRESGPASDAQRVFPVGSSVMTVTHLDGSGGYVGAHGVVAWATWPGAVDGGVLSPGTELTVLGLSAEGHVHVHPTGGPGPHSDDSRGRN